MVQLRSLLWHGLDPGVGTSMCMCSRKEKGKKKKKKSKRGINVHQNLLRKTKYQDALMGEFHKNEASCYTLTILKMTIIAVVF